MDAPQGPFYRKDEPDPMAGVRDAMSRRGDFDPSPARYADEVNHFEVLAVLEALTIEDEVLA
ncbi:MAG: hypothetical protein M3R38_10910 [Actinomycetota bacterium]|nr:hypothetical protein [Actinomycetota bacterium]MDP9476174.1 hypothetical protein [Actinomycetota bacterium]